MGEFTFIKYRGEDAGEVLLTMIHGPAGEEEPEVHEVSAKTQIGFRPNDEEAEPEDEEEEDGGEDTD